MLDCLPFRIDFEEGSALRGDIDLQFSQLVQDGLLNALISRLCPSTNTILTSYKELGISLRGNFCSTELPILREIYNELFHANNIVISKKLPYFLSFVLPEVGRFV